MTPRSSCSSVADNCWLDMLYFPSTLLHPVCNAEHLSTLKIISYLFAHSTSLSMSSCSSAMSSGFLALWEMFFVCFVLDSGGQKVTAVFLQIYIWVRCSRDYGGGADYMERSDGEIYHKERLFRPAVVEHTIRYASWSQSKVFIFGVS